MSQHKIIYTYNPLNQSDEELLENFVIRKNEFNKIVRVLKDSKLTSSAQNFLIEGQRGTGKTSLLMRVRYEIQNDKQLSNLVAVQFAEEQYGIFDLCRLWEKTADVLDDIDGFEGISDALEDAEDEEDYSKECFFILEKYLIKNRKRLVLLIDNFGDLLSNISDIEAKRLRDIFHTSKYIQIIAATAISLEHTYRHDKPFFEFFKMIKLEGLNSKETNTLLKQLSHISGTDIEEIIDRQPARIETMRRLTGGIPRTIVLLFEVFLDDSADIFEDLEGILEKVTPLYKHRMDDLPKQQKAIMDTIALNWDGISAKEIVLGLKKRAFDTKSVSAQLKLLERNALITSKFVDKKNKIYFVKERFFNIWYLMRYGKKRNKSEVLWLVKFLRAWCSDDEILERVDKFSKLVDAKQVNEKGAYYMMSAYRVLLDNIIQKQEKQKKSLTQETITNFYILLSQKQYHYVYNIFQEYPDLKKEFKPFYYALMTLMKDEFPKEYLKMGSELEETVNEILVSVAEYSKKYEA